MAASSAFVLRLTSSGVDDILSALRGVAGNSAEAKRALDTLSEAVGRSGASLSDLQSGAGKASAAAVATDRDLAKLTTQLNRLAAEGDPAVASMQKLAQAEQLLAQAAAKGVPVTAQQLQGIEALRRRNEQLATSMAGASTAITTANDNAAAGFGRFRAAMGQAGYQVQDFVVQVQGGQSALVAMSQQGSQLLGVFGPTGAIAGAALTIGLLAVQIISGLDATKRWTEAIDAQEKGLQRASDFAKEWRDGLKDEADKVKDLAEYYDSLADARRQYEVRAAQRDQVLLTEQQGTFTRDVTGQLGGLTAGFSDQIEQMRLYAAKAYGTGSEEYKTIMSDPDIERMQRAVEVVNNFNQAVSRDGRASVDALAELTTSLRSLADQGSDPASRSILRAADEMEKMDPKARELATAARQLEERLQALGLKAGEAADRAAKLRAEMDALARRALENPTAAIDGDIGKIEAQIAALQKGSAAYRSVIADQDQVTRANTAAQKARDDLTKSLKDAGKSEDDIKAALDAQGPAIDAAANRYATLYRRRDDLNKQVAESEAAAERRAKAAERSASQEIKAAERVAAERARIDAGRDPETGYSNDVTVRLDAMRKTANEKAQREEEKRQKEAQHALEKQQLEADKATDSIVDYAGDRFADLFSKNGDGWKGMLDTFEQTAKATMARIAAEMILRPIIAPIVSGLMGSTSLSGSAGTGALGGSGVFSGLTSSLGLTGIGDSLGIGGFGSSLSGLLDARLWGGLSSTAAAQATAPLAANMYGPTLTQAGLATAGPATTVGTVLGGAGLGFGAGSLLNTLARGNSTGGTVGSAAGGLAGAAIGSIVPGVGTVLGGLIGGAGGGLLGGLFGGGKGFSGGTIQVEVQDGQLVVAGARSKGKADSASAVAALQQQVTTLNTALSQRGLYLSTSGLVTEQGFGQDSRTADVAGVARSYLASDDPTIQTVIRNSLGSSLEAVLSDVDWAKSVYRPMVDAAQTSAADASEFFVNLRAQTDPLNAAIDKARELGLATDDLAESLQKTTDAAYAARDATVLDIRQGLISRSNAATGNNGLAAQLDAAKYAGDVQVRQLETQLKSLGFTPGDANGRYGEVNQLIAVLEQERSALVQQYTMQRAANDNALADRLAAADGSADTAAGALASYNRKATLDWLQAAADGITDLTKLQEVQNAERLKISEQYQQQALQSQLSAMQTLASQSKVLTGWLDSQKLSSSLTSPSSALAEAQRQLSMAVEAARVAGPTKADLSAVTSAASSVISAGSAYYGTSSGQAAIETMVRQTVNSLGAQLDLPGWTDDVVGAVARVVAAQETGTAAIVSEIQQLRDEFVKLRLRMAA